MLGEPGNRFMLEKCTEHGLFRDGVHCTIPMVSAALELLRGIGLHVEHGG